MNEDLARARWWNELYAWAKSVHTSESPMSPEEFMAEMEVVMDKNIASLRARRVGGAA